jgi:SAM-dependent methyltransferase
MQFDFGKNWKEFSEKALSPEKIQQARDDFLSLTEGIGVSDSTFLDIGFGQGLTLLIACEAGARVVGCEINPISREVLEYNMAKFPQFKDRHIHVIIGSVLDPEVINELKKAVPIDGNLYDIVHSWGVLHHTGRMWDAINNAGSLVRPGGHFIISIYNRHWTSKIWLMIKWLYNNSPQIIRKLFIYSFIPIIYVAKFLVTWRGVWTFIMM